MKRFAACVFYTSFCLATFLCIHGLAFVPTILHEQHKKLGEFLVSAFWTLVMSYLVEYHLITKDRMRVVSDCIKRMHEKLERHHIVQFAVMVAFLVIGMLLLESHWIVAGVTASVLTLFVSGCALYTTPEAAAIVASPVSHLSMVTVFGAYRRSHYEAAGVLLVLTICCFQCLRHADVEEKKKELSGGTHPKSL